jgi:hypothetical protein
LKLLRRTSHPLAKLEPEARHPPLCYALALAPERVLGVLLGDPRVAQARLATLGTLRGREAQFVVERDSADPLRFVLAGRASEPGVWEPGAYAVLEGRVEARPAGGSRLVLRFRLHPLTRAAFLTVLGIAALIIPLQWWWTTGLWLGTAMMFPIVLAAALVGLDSRRLSAQRATLQRLVEELFEPLALARETSDRCAFRSGHVEP